MIRCPRCGAKNKDHAPYCGRCRYPFKKQAKRPQKKKQAKKPKRTFKLPKRLQNINKKRLAIVIIVILAVAIAGYYIFGDKHVDVGGLKFTIPNSFDEKYSDQLVNYTGANNTSHEPIDYSLKVYENDKGDELAIDVSAPSGKRVFTDNALEHGTTGELATINGQEGYFINSTQFEYSFEFIKHGKLVCVRSNNMTFIESVV